MANQERSDNYHAVEKIFKLCIKDAVIRKTVEKLNQDRIISKEPREKFDSLDSIMKMLQILRATVRLMNNYRQ